MHKDCFSFLGLKLVSVVIMIRIPSVFMYTPYIFILCYSYSTVVRDLWQ